MKVIQLIDSLDAGGAERMAINFANSLSDKIDFSGLIVTRREGQLKDLIDKKVQYLFIEKKTKIDIKFLFKLRKYIKKNKIEIIHAHGSSFFSASLLKVIYPKIKLIWHEHNGGRINQKQNQNCTLYLCSYFFDAIITVNLDLKEWCLKFLNSKKVEFIPNFVKKQKAENNKEIKLHGDDNRRIVCLANLRNPKNHLFLLKAFYESQIYLNNWSLHLLGKDSEDEYSTLLKEYISLKKINDFVFIYGEVSNVYEILNQATVGILSSTHEGFPVTLLEYGFCRLCVISTNVGHCKEIIIHEQNGLLFDPTDLKSTVNCLNKLSESEEIIKNYASKFSNYVDENFSEEIVVRKTLKLYKSIK